MAVGDTLASWSVLENEAPSASAATVATLAGTADDEVQILEFDDAADKHAQFSDVMPSHYGGGAIDAKIGWTSASASSGTARLQGAFKSFTDDADNLTTKGFASPQNVGAVAPSAAGKVVYDTIAFTSGQIDGVLKGEYFRFRFTRDGDGTSGTDDMVGNAQLVSVELLEA